MEDDVSAFKTGRKLGYLPDVSDDDAGCPRLQAFAALFLSTLQAPTPHGRPDEDCGPGCFLKALCCL